MGSFFSAIVATFVTIPILAYLLVFIISKQVTRQHRRSVHIALDVSTLLFVISVHYLIVTIWAQSYLWVIFLSMLIIAVIFVIIHWRVKQEINFTLIFKGFWRLNFFIFFTAYVVLMVIGLVQSVSAFVSVP
ncbi:DUF3397 domain-containing protein [Bacillus sp. FJAT-29790]|uniref:DUF3397 domain-containing protein n=1 Tax=Bacillus sp. FJAT-29790 TaxID=1895002 RepID=UPI001C23B245|nr:DUF3397 domain-containing protein [Bacillus sp. FJAT-29790]MBU8877713.1 DUF3397 domain-containing protein [Bacillus sp. FJAT-29790]